MQLEKDSALIMPGRELLIVWSGNCIPTADASWSRLCGGQCREAAGMRSHWGHTTESLELVTCADFIGPPGSGASLAQPFEVRVEGQVSHQSP